MYHCASAFPCLPLAYHFAASSESLRQNLRSLSHKCCRGAFAHPFDPVLPPSGTTLRPHYSRAGYPDRGHIESQRRLAPPRPLPLPTEGTPLGPRHDRRSLLPAPRQRSRPRLNHRAGKQGARPSWSHDSATRQITGASTSQRPVKSGAVYVEKRGHVFRGAGPSSLSFRAWSACAAVRARPSPELAHGRTASNPAGFTRACG